MALDPSLACIQRWMQAVVVYPGTVDQAVETLEAQREIPAVRIGEVVLPSRTLTPTERVGVYQGMYLLRMTDALASDYPALQHFVGEESFARLVRGFVQVHPSRSHSLNHLGDEFPDYVRTAIETPRRPEFCYELACLEQAVAQVFDAPETPVLTPEAVATVPADAWETARLRPIDGFRLLSFRHPVNAYLQSVRDEDHDHPKPRTKACWVAVHRRNYSVYRLDLTRAAYDLLADLASATPLGAAVMKAVQSGGRRAPREDELFRWFREWVAAGLFRALEGS